MIVWVSMVMMDSIVERKQRDLYIRLVEVIRIPWREAMVVMS